MTGDRLILLVGAGALVALTLSSLIARLICRRSLDERGRASMVNLQERIWSWWVMCLILFGCLYAGRLPLIVLFALISFFALREFITLTYTRRADHRTLFWSFFVIVPLQYWLVADGWYGLFSILIPVYAFAFVAMRGALAGDSRHYFERTAKIQWGLMLCVYSVSHIPFLLNLEIPTHPEYDGRLLILWCLIVVQSSDVLQYVWGKTLGRHKIAPALSPNKTIEGFAGGTVSAALIGMALVGLTPFTLWEALGLAYCLCLLGFVGGLIMSAIKRDAGIKDFSNFIPGHGGVLDRIDSLCFSAPVLFHVVRYVWT
jgi:phosphatidate cytidylyltransferase